MDPWSAVRSLHGPFLPLHLALLPGTVRLLIGRGARDISMKKIPRRASPPQPYGGGEIKNTSTERQSETTWVCI